MKKKSLKTALASLSIGAACFAFLATDTPRLLQISQNMEIFANVYRTINQEYADETDPNLLMRVALDSMLNSLDPYTNFFSEAQMEQVRINVSGGWDGIGVEVLKHNGKIVVKEVIEKSPAEEQKIRVGDVLLEADGADLSNKDTESVEQILNGKEGTQISIRVLRPSTNEERALTLTRQKIVKKNVPYYAMLDDKTAYIVLTTFTEKASDNIADALKELQEDHKPQQVILDLRENGGGLLIEAVNICNIFLDKNQEIVTTVNRIAEWDRTFKTLNAPVDTKIPLVVLINGHSASASEIVAGALQDFDRGVLLGRQSFGKGLVQNTRDVGYNSKIKLTISKYYIPSGRCIQALEYKDGKAVGIADSLKKTFKTKKGRLVYDGNGLRPDYPVEMPAKSVIAQKLLDNRYIFEYANLYREENDSIASAETFKLSDNDFQDFVSFLKKRNYLYKLDSEGILDKLREAAEKENLLAQVQSSVDKVYKQLEEAKKDDLEEHKAEILHLLEQEIAARYYYEKGRIQVTLRNDKDVQEAIKLFADKAKFDKLLMP